MTRSSIISNEYKRKFWGGRSLKSILQDFLYPAALCFIATAIIIPALVYFLVYDIGDDDDYLDNGTCVIVQGYRVPCGFIPGEKIGNLSMTPCQSINCCFDNSTKECYHYLPSIYGYRKTPTEYFFSRKQIYTPMGNPMHYTLKVSVTPQSDNLIIKLYPDDTPTVTRSGTNGKITYNLYKDTLDLDVYRYNDKSNKIFQTTRGPLIASDGYWEWTMQLLPKNGSLYGLGNLYMPGNTTKVLYRNEHDHTSLPLVLAQFEGQFHAVVIECIGILEVHILESKMIVLRALNTNGITVKLIPGPTLDDINRQLQRPSVLNVDEIPRWMMGRHYCPNLVKDVTYLVEEFERDNDNSLDFSSDCFNELFTLFFMEHEDNGEITRQLGKIVSGIINDRKQKFIMPFTPHVPIGEFRYYKLAVDKNVLLLDSTKEVYSGVYKNRKVAYLDFQATNIEYYMKTLFKAIEEVIIPFDKISGMYLFDNWPQDDNRTFINTTDEKLIYFDEEILKSMNKTIPLTIMNGVNQQQTYVQDQIGVITRVIQELAPRNKIPIMSAAHFDSIQTPMIPQHVNLTRTNLIKSTTQQLFNNLFAHPVTFNPVCGTGQILDGRTGSELCARWFINTATHPGKRFTNNWFLHKNFTGNSKDIARKALAVERSLSYYQYGLLRKTGTVLKPMISEFFADNNTLALNQQYMMGDLLILNDISLSYILRIYLPKKYNWYEFWGGTYYDHGWKRITVSIDQRIFFIKEGSMVPLLSKSSTDESFSIMIAMKCIPEKYTNETVIESSILFETESLQIELRGKTFSITNILKTKDDIGCATGKPIHPSSINKLTIYNCNKDPETHDLKGFNLCSQVNDDFSYEIEEPPIAE